VKNISFALTQPQVSARTKTVTRRGGWKSAIPGLRLRGVNKCQGLKAGEHPVELALIEVVSVRVEPLERMTLEPEYGRAECILEGFPDMSPEDFVAMYCDHNAWLPGWPVTRIEFRYL
jgi:hypothetical protein